MSSLVPPWLKNYNASTQFVEIVAVQVKLFGNFLPRLKTTGVPIKL